MECRPCKLNLGPLTIAIRPSVVRGALVTSGQMNPGPLRFSRGLFTITDEGGLYMAVDTLTFEFQAGATHGTKRAGG